MARSWLAVLDWRFGISVQRFDEHKISVDRQKGRLGIEVSMTRRNIKFVYNVYLSHVCYVYQQVSNNDDNQGMFHL